MGYGNYYSGALVFERASSGVTTQGRTVEAAGPIRLHTDCKSYASLIMPNVRKWLESEVQSPEIDFRSSPNFRHSAT